MFIAIASLTALGLSLGALLGLAARYLKVESNPIVEQIEGMLPGSQCGQCGYPGCTPAAAAMASGEAPVTCCPPGGRALAEELAKLLGVSADLSGVGEPTPTIAVVNEALCVGCTRCFKRCPTDAIVGASKKIHGIFPEACNGCGQCVDACPTGGIALEPVAPTLKTWYWPLPVG